MDCYFCNGLQKRMLEHREESGVPKGNRTYVDAKTPGKSTNRGLTASSISVTPVPLEPPSALTRLEAHQRQAFPEEVVQTSHTPDPLHEGGDRRPLSRASLECHGTIRWASLVPAAMTHATPWPRLSGKPDGAVVAPGIAIA